METKEIKKVAPRAIKKTDNKIEERRIIKKSIIIALAIMVLAWIDLSFNISAAMRSSFAARGQMQAVFLTNGQVYFGNLSRFGMDYWKLDNVYYPHQITEQVPAPIQQNETQKKNGESETPIMMEQTRTILVKLSQEAHQPDDTLFIPRANILFWENMSASSSVSQTIASGR